MKSRREEPDQSARDQAQRNSPRISFDEIAHGSSEVVIEFDGQDYRLRVTRNGKLILNK